MRNDEFESFSLVLDGVCLMLSRGNYTPNATSAALFFKALQNYDIADVKAAFGAHLADPQRGKFPPVPADLIAQLQARDGRPDDAEAWTVAVQAADEAETVVWTAETAAAWALVSAAFTPRDQNPARMAFRSAYARLVAEAREQRRPVKWETSEGHDKARHRTAMHKAAELGRIPHGDIPALAPPEGIKALANLSTCPVDIGKSLQASVEALKPAPASPDSAELPQHHPRTWAILLRDREKAGEKLAPLQRRCWREALEGMAAPSQQGLAMGCFSPVPASALPPGMRK